MKPFPISLDNFKSWFHSEQTFNAFCEMLKQAHALSDGDIVPVLVDGSPICGLVTAECVIKDRLVRRIAEKPQILDDLADRLNNDKIVD